MVPPNVIELTNTLASYKGATPVLVDGETVVARFTVVAPSNTTNIVARCLSPTVNKVYGNNKFKFGYLVFDPTSTLSGQWSAIASNISFNAGGGVFRNEFLIYNALPWAPTPGDTFYVSTQFPMIQADGSYFGFPYVPSPQAAL